VRFTAGDSPAAIQSGNGKSPIDRGFRFSWENLSIDGFSIATMNPEGKWKCLQPPLETHRQRGYWWEFDRQQEPVDAENGSVYVHMEVS
jgi:hypothetical protein